MAHRQRIWILYALISIALLATLGFALGQYLRVERAERALESAYAQRLTESGEHLQSMEIKLRKAPVTADETQLLPLLMQISRQADSVASGLGALPLSHAAMADTMRFCNQLSEYGLALATRLAGGDALAPDDFETLGTLQSQCALLAGQLATARGAMLAQTLRFAGDESVYYQEAQLDARPLEQVADKDNGMDYPTMIYDGAFSDARHFGPPKALGTERIDAQAAVRIAVGFVGEDRVKIAQPGPQTEGLMAAYGVELTLMDGLQLTAEVTRQGGQMLWMVPERASFPEMLTLSQCERRALDFLAVHGYGRMEANHFQRYDGLAVINFVAVQDGVPLYPDLVKLQLRMDTGEVVGMEANNYLSNHRRRDDLTPTLTAAQAEACASARLTRTGTRLCVIPYREDERLCYELSGTYGQNEYRVYIDAETGNELEVLLLLKTPDGEMSA